jgi:hypothetical protein
VVELLKADAELAATIETEVRLALSSFGVGEAKVDTELDIIVDEPLEEEIETTEESYLE